MKKKIKDLNYDEKNKICDKYQTCENCPLRLHINDNSFYRCAYSAEVEVDE